MGTDVAGRALVAMGVVGAMDLGAVKGHQQAPPRRSKGCRASCSCRVRRPSRKRGSNDSGGDAVEQVAILVVAADALDAVEVLAVGAVGFVLPAALEGEEGGRLEDEEGEGAGRGLGDGVALVAALAGIGQGSDGPAEGGQEAFQNISHDLWFN